MKLPFGRRVTAMLPYALAFFILFFLAGVLLTTAIVEMGATSAIFTSMAIPLACGALAFFGCTGRSDGRRCARSNRDSTLRGKPENKAG